MAKRESEDVQQFMSNLAQGNGASGEQELVLDPRTGKLVLTPIGGEVSPDAVPATDIAREGFFSGLEETM